MHTWIESGEAIPGDMVEIEDTSLLNLLHLSASMSLTIMDEQNLVRRLRATTMGDSMIR